MKKVLFSLLLGSIALTSCSQKAAQPTEETTPQASLNGNVATLNDGTVVTWIKDNAGERKMPRDLFPEARDEGRRRLDSL